jgi:hypothetical protein
MRVVVQDANVLIDLEQAGLYRRWFDLGIETWTTDLILHQIRVERQPDIHRSARERLLGVKETSGALMERMFQMKADVPAGLELEDVSALFWAVELDAALLTGDRLLAREARTRRIVVRGSLWVMDQLVERKVVHPREAANGLQTLLRQGRRLPLKECRTRIQAWRSA